MNVLFTALLSDDGSIIDLDAYAVGFSWGCSRSRSSLFRPLVFRPMVRLFEARENAIEGAKLEALRLQDEAAAETQEFEDEMRRLRLQAGEERDRLRAEGKRLEKQRARSRSREDGPRGSSPKPTQKLSREAGKLRAARCSLQSVPALAKADRLEAPQPGGAMNARRVCLWLSLRTGRSRAPALRTPTDAKSPWPTIEQRRAKNGAKKPKWQRSRRRRRKPGTTGHGELTIGGLSQESPSSSATVVNFVALLVAAFRLG